MNKAIKRYSVKASQVRRKQPQLRKLARLRGFTPVLCGGLWQRPSSIRYTLPH